MSFAREGFPFITIAALLTAGGYAWALNRRSWPLWVLAFVLTLLTLWVAYFFRDPERIGERGDHIVIAPADGRIVQITEVDEQTMLKGKALRVSIFMNVFNVHVNRYPVTGRVFATHYNPGLFVNAAADKASLDNEQSTVGIEMGKHKILVRQIAGLIARRIITYSKVGDSARQGDRFGIIRFGSRVDVFMPVGSTVRVKLDQLTTAGVTVLGDSPVRAPLPPPNMRRRVVVMFPSGLTLLNLFFGVFAIVAASRELYMQAGWYVILGGIADAFDGRVARATNSEGRFGEELDSLVDVVTFGLAPALIMYFAVMNRAGWDWLWCFAFTACAVLRLARFNVEQAGTNKTYFHGLPSPAAGITLATYYWFSQSKLYNETAIADWSWHQMLRIVMAVLGFLMVSNVPYPVMPPIGFRSPRQLIGLGILVCGTAMLIFGRLEYFFPLAVGYVAFGLLRGVILGLIERQQLQVPAGWFPGGDDPGTDGRVLNSVGDGFSEDEGDARYFRRQRRRTGKGERGERGGSGPNNPS